MHIRNKSALIATASALAMMSSTAVLAQDTETFEDEVVATGIRQSIQQSLDTKRNADSIVEAITAVDIGKFPDKNVAESLQRLTGVTINREFGEGERVSIRGTDTNLTRTLLNGHAVASADWFILDQLNASRSFNYLLLPSEIVRSVEVYKSPQADLDEGGIGGTVNVKTLRPLDGQDLSIAGSIGASYNALADEASPTGSLLVNWRNADKTFGLNVAGVYQEREFRRDGFEILGYSRVDANADLNNIPAGGVDVPDLIGSALFRQTRERIGFNAAAQFAPTDQLDIVLSGLYYELDANNTNTNFLLAPSRKGGDGNFFTVGTVEDDTALSGSFAAGGSGFSLIYDAFYREASSDTMAIDLDVNYTLNDRNRIHVNGGYTEANGGTDRQLGWEALATAPGFSYDLTSGVPEVTIDDSVDVGDPNDPFYVGEVGWAGAAEVQNTDDEFYVFGDYEHDLQDKGVFKSVKIGAKYTDHTRDVLLKFGQRRSLFSWAGPVATGCDGNGNYQTFETSDALTAAGFRRCGFADISEGLTPGNFLEDIAAPGSLTSYSSLDTNAARAVLDAIPIPDYPGPAAGVFCAAAH